MKKPLFLSIGADDIQDAAAELKQYFTSSTTPLRPQIESHLAKGDELRRLQIDRVLKEHGLLRNAAETEEQFEAILAEEEKLRSEIIDEIIRRNARFDLRIKQTMEAIKRMDENFARRNDGLIEVSPICREPSRVGDVVFIHGLDGDAITTWCHDGKLENYWPRWLGEDLSTVGVWSLGYQVASSAWTGRAMLLQDRAANALARLDAHGLGQRPLAFITHSMGGLLIKQMLRQSSDKLTNKEWKAIHEQTKGIVFLSTPHAGSRVANWIKYLSWALRNTVAVSELEYHDDNLRALNDWFRNNIEPTKVAIQAYFENMPFNGVIVVDEQSGNPGMTGLLPIPMDANHSTICKPSSKGDMTFQRVKRFVQECFASTG